MGGVSTNPGPVLALLKGSDAWMPVGHQVDAAHTFATLNPASAEVIAHIRGCSFDDYEQVIQTAVASFKAWRDVPAPRRGELVRVMGNKLRTHKDALGTLVSLETGKIKAEGDGEVQEMIDIADFAVSLARMLYGKTMHSERPHHRMYEQWHPLGVVGVVTAFNFPVAVWAWNAFIAAIAGDSVVWKPSPKAPLCAIAVHNLCVEAMRDLNYPGVFSLLLSDHNEIVDHLAVDTRVVLLSFTGSSAVGVALAQTVARRMGKSLLECSGNNAVIVDDSANLYLAVPALLFGAVGTAGQRCTTTRRLIVHESRYDELLGRLIAAYRQVTVGDPLKPGTLMGPLIDAGAVERFRAAIAEVRSQGGTILHGGETLPGPGYFVQPTIVRARNHWDVVQRETFAPILYVMTFDAFTEAIALQNAVPQGLSSALFTERIDRTEQFLSACGSDCGIANINIGTSGAEIGGAFGGEKQTGGGREAGSDAWQQYMRRQTNTINWGRDLPLAQGIEFRQPRM